MATKPIIVSDHSLVVAACRRATVGNYVLCEPLSTRMTDESQLVTS